MSKGMNAASSMKCRIASAVPVLLLLLAGVACEFRGMHQYGSERNGQFWWRHGPREVTVNILGDVEFADDDRDVKRLSSDGYLLIEESVLLDSKAVEFSLGPGDAVRRRVLFNGEEAPFDSEAQTWLTRILPEVLRQTGIGAAERAARILDTQGFEAFLDEVLNLPRDRVVARYLEEAVGRTDLNQEQQLEIVRTVASRVGSDSQKTGLLLRLAPSYQSPALFEGLLQAGDTVGSDGHKARLLQALIEQRCEESASVHLILASVKQIGSDTQKAATLGDASQCLSGDHDVRAAYFDALATIGSDGNKANLLRNLVREHGDDEQTLLAALKTASTVGSDSNKGAFLAEAAEIFLNTNAIREAYFNLVDQIGSDSNRASALLALTKHGRPDEKAVARLYASAAEIGSDSAKASVLTGSLSVYQERTDVMKEFFRAVDRIGSSSNRAGVLLAVVSKPDIKRPTLLQVMESAKGIGSDSNKASVLVQVARLRPRDSVVIEHLRVAAKTLGSDSSYRAVLLEINKGASSSD